MRARSLMVIAIRILALLCLAGAAGAQTFARCDVNGDGVVNQVDVRLISASLNRPAFGKLDARDADGDGRITLNDVRVCLQMCRGACNSQNVAPTAEAGPDQSVPLGATVNLSGAQSTDPDGPQPLTYAWQFTHRPPGSSAVLSNAAAINPSFVADVAGLYVVDLVVGDGLANSSPDSVAISTQNSAPVAHAGPDQSAFVGDRVVVDGSASTDVDGDFIAYQWTLVGRPPGSAAALTTNPKSPAASFVVDVEGTYAVQLVAFDGRQRSAPDVVLITTGNTPPVANPKASCAAAPNVDCSAPIGSLITLDGSASTDVDGNPLTYAWSLVGRPAGSAAVLSAPTSISTTFQTDVPGNFAAQLIVNDGSSNSAPKTVTVTSTNVKPVAAATVNPISIASLPQLVQLDGSGSTDPEGQGLTYAWSLLAKPAGSAAALSSATAVTPTFTADTLGTYTAQLIVNDGFLSSTPVTVSASTTNQPPTANAGSDIGVFAGATVQLSSAGSSDPEGSPLGYFWSMLNKPAGSAADFNNANAANPTFVADRVGTYIAQLIVNDGVLFSAPDTVQVNAANSAPLANPDSYSTAEDTTLVVGAAAGVLANDFDGNGDPLTAILVGANPAGLALGANGGFAYAPPADFNGTTTFQYKANDGLADSNTVTVTITVTPVNDPPIANAGPNQNLPAAGLVQLTGAASSDPEGQPLTYAWTLTAKPAGSAATLSSATIVSPTFTADVGGTYTAQLIVNDGSLPSTPSTVTINVAALPTVTIAATDANASETGPDPGVFTFTRTGPTTLGLPINFTSGGTATNFFDYQTISSQVTIPAGQTSATVTITPVADALIEPAETVVLTIDPSPTTYLVGAQNTATVTIADGVSNVVTIAATDANASETGPDPGVFTFTRTGPTTFNLPVNYSIGGTATNFFDYQTISSQVTILAGQTSATVTITPVADALIEPAETVILTIDPSPATYLVGAQNTATVTIADGVSNVVTIAATDANASETGPDPGVFTFTRTGPTTFDLPVNYSIGGTATNFFDYQTISSQVTIPAGQASVTLTITPVADALIEPAETVVLTLTASPTTYLIGAQNSATVTIADGVSNVVTIAATDANASETGPDPGVFTFTRTGPTTFDLPVNYSIGGGATNFFDYQTISSQVTIPAGQASVTLTITPVADALIEPAETVVLTIDPSPTTYLVGAQNTATVTIADGVSNVVTIAATQPNASETGPVSGQFTFTRTGPTTFDLPVNFNIGGTATNFFDYQTISSQVIIPAGQASATLTITPVADNQIEPAETVILTLTASPTTYLIGAQNSATVNIADGVSNVVTIAATDANASETGPDPGVFTFTRTGPTTFDLAVNFNIGGTATNFFDYQTISSQVIIPAGQASATLTITPVADNQIEPAETVILTLTASPTTYLIGAQNSATVTIADGVPNVVTIAATDASASETGPDPGVFTFTRTGPTTFDLAVNFNIGGTASNFFDYQTISSQVIIPAGQASATLTITPVADGLVEPAETVILTITPTPATYLVGAQDTATVTITD